MLDSIIGLNGAVEINEYKTCACIPCYRITAITHPNTEQKNKKQRGKTKYICFKCTRNVAY